MEIESLTREQEDAVLQSIKYSREQLERDVVRLKDWLSSQTQFPASRLKESDVFYRSYLVGCKGNFEKTTSKLTFYYGQRNKNDITRDLCNRDKLKQTKDYLSMVTMKKPLPNGSRLMMVSVKSEDSSLFIPVNAYKRKILHFEYAMRCGSGITGPDYVLVDMKNYRTGHVIKGVPRVKPLLDFVQRAYANRIGKIILFESPSWLTIAINTFIKPLLTKKIKERMIVTNQSVDQVIDFLQALPCNYGGQERDVFELGDETVDKLLSSDFLVHLEEGNTESTPIDEEYVMTSEQKKQWLSLQEDTSFKNLTVD